MTRGLRHAGRGFRSVITASPHDLRPQIRIGNVGDDAGVPLAHSARSFCDRSAGNCDGKLRARGVARSCGIIPMLGPVASACIAFLPMFAMRPPIGRRETLFAITPVGTRSAPASSTRAAGWFRSILFQTLTRFWRVVQGLR